MTRFFRHKFWNKLFEERIIHMLEIFIVCYESVEKEKTFECGCVEERIYFCQVNYLRILEGFDIQSRKKQPQCEGT
jgi:hypothetical protein